MQAKKPESVMFAAVIDTNVIVSSAISANGNPSEIMTLFYTGKLCLFYTDKILAEYKRVLAYKKLNIAEKTQIGIIDALEAGGTLIEAPKSNIPMSDESDRIFYDAAKASGSILITGNLRHYPAESFIMNPAGFLQYIQSNS